MTIGQTDSWSTFRALLGKVGKSSNLSNDEIKKLLKQADKDKDGLITELEFKDAFVSAEKYSDLEDDFMDVFEKISALDGTKETMSEADILKAIEASEPPPSSGGDKHDNNGGNEKPLDLSSKDLSTLQSERSSILSDLSAKRTERDNAVAQANNEINTSRTAYNDATKSLNDAIKAKMEGEEQVNEYAQQVADADALKTALNDEVTTQQATVSEAKTLVGTVSSQLSSLTAPPETISYVDETTGETVTQPNPAYQTYLQEKAALEEQLAQAEADLADQEELLVSLEEQLTAAEANYEACVEEYITQEQTLGRELSPAETQAIEALNVAKQKYDKAKQDKADIEAKYDKDLEQLRTNLDLYNDEISERKMTLPEGYEVKDGLITNGGDHQLVKLTEDQLPEGYVVDNGQIKDKDGNVVGSVTGTDDKKEYYVKQDLPSDNLTFSQEFIIAHSLLNGFNDKENKLTVEQVWKHETFGNFAAYSPEDLAGIEEIYNRLVREHNETLEEGQIPALEFEQQAEAILAGDELKVQRDAVKTILAKNDSKIQVSEDNFESYLKSKNVDLATATEAELKDLLDDYIDTQVDERVNKEHYPTITDEQMKDVLGDGGLESLKDADAETINTKIAAVLNNSELTPYQQMKMIDAIKQYSPEAKTAVDTYFKTNDEYFASTLAEMTSAVDENGELKYSSDDLLEFVKQYKCLDNVSGVLGSEDKVGDKSEYLDTMLELYERMENPEQIKELENYLGATQIQKLATDKGAGYAQQLFQVVVNGSVIATEDGELSTTPDAYGLKDTKAIEEKYLNIEASSSDKIKAVIAALDSKEINSNEAKYLISKISGGNPDTIIAEIYRSTDDVSKVFELFSTDKVIQPYFSEDINMTTQYVKDGDGLPFLLIGPENVDPNAEMPLIIYLHGSGERAGGEAALMKDNLPGGIISNWELSNFNGYVLCPNLESTSDTWANADAEKQLRALIAEFQKTHNVDTSKIFIGGHSLGANGALYMAEHMDDVFTKGFVISGYEHDNLYNIEDIEIDMRGYVAEADHENSLSYITGEFKDAVGEENVFIVSGQHGKSPVPTFNMDSDGNGIPDIIEWLFED